MAHTEHEPLHNELVQQIVSVWSRLHGKYKPAYAFERMQAKQCDIAVQKIKRTGIRHVMHQLISLLVVGFALSSFAPAHAQVSPERYFDTASSSYEYDPVTGQVVSATMNPNTPVCVKVTYQYDRFGNNTNASTANCGSGGRAAFTTRSIGVQYPAQTVNVAGVSGVAVPEGSFASLVTNGLGHQESRKVDPRFGVATVVTSPNGLATTLELDDFGRVVRARSASGTSTVSFYCIIGTADNSSNTPGCPTPSTDETPKKATRFVHTESRNTADVKNGAYTRAYFGFGGNVLRTVTEAFDGSSQAGGDKRLIVQDNDYNWRGAAVISTQPYFFDTKSSLATGSVQYGMTNVVFDVMGRPTAVYTTNSKGSQSQVFGTRGTFQASRVTYVYDGLSTTTTNDKGYSTKEERNAEGKAVRMTDALGAQLAHQYNGFGDLVQTKDALQNVVSIGYDAYGRKIQLNDPDAGIQKYDYNALGELVWQESANQRAKQQTTTFAYDVLGRMTERIEPEFTSTWTYDKYADGSVCVKGIGKLCETRTSNGVADTVVYDAWGRPLRSVTVVTNGPTFTSSISYDQINDRVADVTYPTGLKISNSYTTEGGFLEKNSNGTKVLWQTHSVNAWGKPEQFVAGNGVQTNVALDPKTGDTNEISAGASGSVLKHSYTYDSLSNLETRKDFNGPGNGQPVLEEYVYDAVNRLKSYGIESVGMTVPTDVKRTVIMEYNALGSMLSKSDVGAYMYPAAGAARPHAVLSVTGTRANSYLYDANGNMTVAAAGKYRTLAYTSFDLPDSDAGILGGDGTRYTWQYDISHARTKEVRRDGQGTRTTWMLHPDKMGGLGFEQEFGTSGAISNRHYVAGGMLTTSGPITSAANPQPTDASAVVTKEEYWHYDHLGSIGAITDASGAVTQRMAYDPFGKRRAANGNYDVNGNIIIDNAQGTDRGFTGHEHLDDVGIIHMNGRIYDPAVGRFMQADPMIQSPELLQNFDRYSYVLNNPLNLTDPSGYQYTNLSSVYQTPIINTYGGCSTSTTGLFSNSNLFCNTPNSGGWFYDGLTFKFSSNNHTPGIGSAPGVGYVPPKQEVAAPAAPPKVTSGPLKESTNTENVNDFIPMMKRAWKGSFESNETWSEFLFDRVLPAWPGEGAFAGGVSKLWRVGRTAEVAADACGCCFRAGTPVQTENGMMPIEEIRVGQLVFARDPETGETKLKPVTDLITTNGKPLFELITRSAIGDIARLEVTDNHPFWVEGSGWVDSVNLAPGMIMVDYEKKPLQVVALKSLGIVEQTYNFTVADFHTYFAGVQKAFVHNRCACAVGAAALAKAIPVLNPTYKQLVALQIGKVGFQAHHILPQYLGKMLGYTEKQMLDHPATLISQWAHTGALNPTAMHKAIARYLPPRVGNVNMSYTAAQIRVGLERAYNSLNRPELFNSIAPLIK